jgi:hypothetical protein
MIYFCLILIVLFISAFVVVLRKKQMHLWLGHYMRRNLFSKPKVDGPVHIMFCFVDHYEPQWANPNDIEVERSRVDRWHVGYPISFGGIRDADGCLPKHSFFYPEEEYRKEHLDKIQDLCAQGFGEIEIHLHHDDDTSENLRTTLNRFSQTLHESHGSLGIDPATGKTAYGFIHGNWTLDNSHPEGKYCGVNDELIILKETGCYADFTMPSAPSPTQTSMCNSIYYATDDACKPKSHDKGVLVESGRDPSGDLMIVQGPLCLNWKDRKFGVMPRIEAGDIRKSIPPSRHRVDMWVDQHIHVKGKPDWVFVKIHTHGTQEMDIDTLLGEPTIDMYEYLASKYNDGENYVMHFVSSREMYNIIKAAESEEKGNPNEYRDYIISKPDVVKSPQEKGAQ